MNHELQSKVPGLVPNLWELPLMGPLALKKEESLYKRIYSDNITGTKRTAMLHIWSCMYEVPPSCLDFFLCDPVPCHKNILHDRALSAL